MYHASGLGENLGVGPRRLVSDKCYGTAVVETATIYWCRCSTSEQAYAQTVVQVPSLVQLLMLVALLDKFFRCIAGGSSTCIRLASILNCIEPVFGGAQNRTECLTFTSVSDSTSHRSLLERKNIPRRGRTDGGRACPCDACLKPLKRALPLIERLADS